MVVRFSKMAAPVFSIMPTLLHRKPGASNDELNYPEPSVIWDQSISVNLLAKSLPPEGLFRNFPQSRQQNPSDLTAPKYCLCDAQIRMLTLSAAAR